MIETADKLKFVEHDRLPLDPNEPTTLVEIYESVVRNHPKPNNLNYKRDGVWRALSAADMLGRARRLALGLYSLGLRKGDRVALLSESCVEWVLADQGCILMGAISVQSHGLFLNGARHFRCPGHRHWMCTARD